MNCKNINAIAWLLLWANASADVPPIAPADWPCYNYDVRGWRFNLAESTLSPDNAKNLVKKWQFPDSDYKRKVGVIHATPSVVNGHVYFGTATYPAFYKLRPNGSPAWVFPMTGPKRSNKADGGGVNEIDAENGVLSSALVTDTRVYFGSVSGVFFALDRFTGEEKWNVDTRSENFPGHHLANAFLSSPVFIDGTIVVGGGSYEHAQPSNPDYECCTGRGFVIAFSSESGAVVWKYDVGEPPRAYPEPIVIEDANGKHSFKHGPSTSSVWSTPTYDADSNTVFFGTDVHNSPRQPTDDDPRLYTKHSAAIVAIDATTGQEKWVTQINEGDIYNLRMSGYDAQSGKYKDSSIGDSPKVYSIVRNGKPCKVVAAGCKNGGFYVLDAGNGELIASTPVHAGEPKYPLDPPPSSPPLALPSPIGGIQTGCATDGQRIFANGTDWLSLNRRIPGSPEAGRVTSVSLDLASENWRHERRQRSLGLFSVGDPVASGIALGGGLACFTTTISKKLVVLNAASGEELKSIEVGTVWSGPSISRGRIYVGTGSVLFLGTTTTGSLFSFGLPERDEIDEMAAGDEQ